MRHVLASILGTLVLALCVACGGGYERPPVSGPGRGTDSSTGGGGTVPGSGSGGSCSSFEDCAWNYCTCADGQVVNSRTCNNGSCLPSSAICPEACGDRGGWSSSGGGGNNGGNTGGGTSNQCTVSEDCAWQYCTCRNGAGFDVRGCENGACESKSSLCAWACEDNGGW